MAGFDRSTIVFLDASCLIAAAGSPSGGSALLLSLTQRRHFICAVSHPVLVEARRNVSLKLKPPAQAELARLVAATPMVVPVPSVEQLEQHIGGINAKDVHVIAAAIAAGASYLVTLDRDFVDEVNRAVIWVRATSPGECIRDLLPLHPDYPSK